MKSNADRAKELAKNLEFAESGSQLESDIIIQTLDAVRLDEAEWWWNDAVGRKYLEQHERLAQLRANSSGNQAKEQK